MSECKVHPDPYGIAGGHHGRVVGGEFVVERLDDGGLHIHGQALVDIERTHGCKHIGIYDLQQIDKDCGYDGVVPETPVIVTVVFEIFGGDAAFVVASRSGGCIVVIPEPLVLQVVVVPEIA